MKSNREEEKIKVGDKIRVENVSDLLRGRKGFEDFEGKVTEINCYAFGYSGAVKTDERIRVFDTEVHRIIKL